MGMDPFAMQRALDRVEELVSGAYPKRVVRHTIRYMMDDITASECASASEAIAHELLAERGVGYAAGYEAHLDGCYDVEIETDIDDIARFDDEQMTDDAMLAFEEISELYGDSVPPFLLSLAASFMTMRARRNPEYHTDDRDRRRLLFHFLGTGFLEGFVSSVSDEENGDVIKALRRTITEDEFASIVKDHPSYAHAVDLGVEDKMISSATRVLASYLIPPYSDSPVDMTPEECISMYLFGYEVGAGFVEQKVFCPDVSLPKGSIPIASFWFDVNGYPESASSLAVWGCAVLASDEVRREFVSEREPFVEVFAIGVADAVLALKGEEALAPMSESEATSKAKRAMLKQDVDEALAGIDANALRISFISGEDIFE